MTPDIKSQTRQDLADRFADWKQPAYRVAQLLEWLYRHRVTDWDVMTNLPRSLREMLRDHFSLQTLELVGKQGAPVLRSSTAEGGRDTTQKYLWRLGDHSLIESVLIPSNPALYGEASDRHTLCVSTQVGCAYGCKFCASGLEGWKRHLLAHEMVEQVLAVERTVSGAEGQMSREDRAAAGALHASRITHHAADSLADRIRLPFAGRHSRLIDNLVIMGMGEPLANYDNLLKALRILNAPWGAGIGARKITISTSGLAPQIRKLADEPEQFRLAVSLHGATDEVRAKIMPVNRKFPLKELTAALEYYRSKKERMITFEYILIAGVNDSPAQVRPLAALAKQLHAKVNLIPYNRVEGLPWERPEDQVCEAFLAALEKQKVTATLRREKGHEIDAACGQLRLKTERALAGTP